MARRNRSFRPSGRALDILNSINNPDTTSRKRPDRPVRSSRRATHGGERQDVSENREDIWEISASPENRRRPSPPAPSRDTPPQTLDQPEAEPTPRRSRRLQHEAPENPPPLGDPSRHKEQAPDVEEPEPGPESESESEDEEWVSDGKGSEASEQVSLERLEEYSEIDERPDGQQAVVVHETATTKKRKTPAMDSARGNEEQPQNAQDKNETSHHRGGRDTLSSPTSRRQRRRARSSSRVRIEIPPPASSPARSETPPDFSGQAHPTDRALVIVPEPIKEIWFDQARRLGGQEDNWRTLIAEVKVLQKLKVPSVEHHLEYFKGAVDFFLDNYKRTVIVPLRGGDAPALESAARFGDSLAVIQQEGDQVMDVIYELTDPAQRQNLLDGFGARAIEWAFKVVKQCFQAYYLAGERYPAARGHFRRALALLSWFCRRLGSLAGRMQLDARRKRLRQLEKPLAKIQAALESRALEPEAREAPESPNKPGTLRDLAFPYGRKPWTNDEGEVLLDGLQRYQGPDRYYQILSQSGRRLLGRTVLELQEQACELRDRILSQHGEELHNPEGQRKWRWLSSVRED
ncbi:hypothetical protein BDW42DRAFT_177151 [Aspergillus taichungensis]|uniref:Uncharacterized protein n=1 Tax=Aspergillus taichungensis TaxID=482145 RepID=A0A2J5HJH9_9EURO|nr:hypothetical protein BDW42DRAFT_177151 [Aspergillus taichungensis]